jgi:4-amino-4-deoxy-L-arabinose transferase-like glycosyltransferase
MCNTSASSSHLAIGRRYERSRLISVLCLVCLIALHSFVNVVWLSQDQSALTWDPAHHLRYGLIYSDLFAAPVLSWDWIMRVLGTNTWIHPPLYHWMMGLFLAFNRTIFWAKFSNLIWVIVLLVFTYLAGARLWDRQTGLLSAFLVSVYPMTFQFSREIYTDLSAAALTAASLYLLLCSDYFRKLPSSLAFGASIGLGLLTKPTYLTFIAFPLIIVAIQVIREYSPWWRVLTDRSRWQTIGGAIVVALVVALLWYGVMRRWFLTLLVAHVLWNPGGSSLISVESLSYYLLALINAQISLPFFLVFLIAIVSFLRAPAPNRIEKMLIVMGILGPLVVQTFVSNKNDHQDIGILPFVALVTAGGILSLCRCTMIGVRSVVVPLVLAFGFGQFLLLSFSSNMPAVAQQKIYLGPLTVRITVQPRPPVQENWRVLESLEWMTQAVPSSGRNLRIAVIANTPYVNGQTFRGLALLHRLPFEVDKPIDLGFDIYIDRFSGYDFIVTTSTWNPSHMPGNTLHPAGIDRKVFDYFKIHSEQFRLVKTFQLPDGADLLIYQRAIR